MRSEYTFVRLLKRFYWDMRDWEERGYYAYWMISEVPGLFGAMLRARFLARRFKSVGKNLLVYHGARFRSWECLSAGDNVEIGVDSFISAGGGVSLGNDVMLAPGVKIWSANHEYRDRAVPIRQQGFASGPVSIGNDVWIASNAFICPGVTLPDGVVVSAGSIVGVKDYPPYSILAGNPARVIGFRGDGSVPKVDGRP